MSETKLTKRLFRHLNGGSKFSELVYRIYSDDVRTEVYELTRTDGRPDYYITERKLVCGDEELDLLKPHEDAVVWVRARITAASDTREEGSDE
jgi:hypothetical protein